MTITLRGLSYPLRLNGSGGLSISSDVDRLREQIMEILTTRFFERVMRNEFGTDYFIFESPAKGAIEASLNQALQSQLDSEIEFAITVEPDESGSFFILIQWWSEGVPEQSLRLNPAILNQ